MKTTESSPSVIYNYKKVKTFYLLSTLIPWLFWFVAGYVSWIEPHQDIFLNIASVLSFIGLLAPVAISFFLISKDSALRKDVMGRFFNFKDVKLRYFALACLIMPISIMTAQAISLLFGYSPSQFIITGNFTFSSGIFPVWFLLIMAPVFEELAWHSYGTDSLRRRFNLFKTSLIFGIYWGVWHMPLSSIRDYYQSNIVESGWIYGVNFLVSIVPYVLIMNWLYYKTGRNIIITIIFHITAGFFNELFAPHPDTKIIQTVLLLILAVVIVIKDKNLFFNNDSLQPRIQ
ncbi:CPBP family intramembrane glutamic endopeptidase [Prevotella sp. 10(H)]|uniref:CPBP family intramembrane glutamic endopeptidase n=1 Tax=Prevotella sp. 10(H) TaxID=1158294 RepID=UPI0004A6F605|nr:CPBP family intramembrane glutamic endopeptidase [Prevotella sp. 10(H)]